MQRIAAVLEQHPAHEREAVAVHAARREPDERVARPNTRAVDNSLPVDDAGGESGRFLLAVHMPGISAVSPSIRAHPDFSQPSAMPFTIASIRSGTILPQARQSRKNSGSAPCATMSFTHIATASMPIVSCLSIANASISFVPTPSVPETSIGFS